MSLGTTSATVTIDDDEALLVNISADAVSVVEDGSAAYTVRVTGGTSTAPVVVSYTVGGTATSADYTAPTGSLTVASGGASAALAIATLTDLVIDPDETLRVTLSGASTTKGSVSVGTPSAASLALAEAGGLVGDGVAGPGDAERGGGFVGELRGGAVGDGRDGGGGVVEDGGRGRRGSADYTAQSATTLTIAAGDTRSSAFTVATTADTLSEASETFEVQIAADSTTPLPSNVTISPTANTSTATITDDASDALTATVSRAGATVAEGSNAVFTVTLAGGASTAPVTVRYETTGSATSGSDYTAPSGSLTIASGLATGTVTIATTADTVLDRGETLGLRLTGVSGGGGASSLGSTTSAATTITDAGTATVGFSATSRSVDEGREATLRVSLSGAVSAPVTVKWKTTGVSATSGTDYTAQASTAVTIAAGTTTASLTVQTTADSLAEGSETFTVSLEADTDNPLPSGVSLGTTSATVTIDDDEALLVNISADAVSVVEGGSAAYTVRVTGGTSTAPVVVSYTVGGTATSADYTAPTGSLTVASGGASAALAIATLTDLVIDPDETLRVTLSGASTTKGSVSVGTPSAASLALAEPAGSSVTVSLDPATRSVAEGSSASFEAVLSGTVATAVVVSWKTADGTAGSADYTAQSATTLTIAAGDTRSSAFTVATTADTLSEASETFEVQIAADSTTPLPSNVTISPTANTSTATITDDASDALTATVSRAGATVAEGSNAVFTVTLAGGASTAPVTVRYETTGSATSGSDYTAPSGSLTIASGLATGTVTIATTADTVLDRGETLGLRLTGVSGGGGASSLGSTTSAATTITDAGTATVGFSATVSGPRSFEQRSAASEPSGTQGQAAPSTSVAEGQSLTLQVALSRAVAAPVTLKWKTADGTAGSADYTARAASVTLPAGTTTTSLTVQTTGDVLAEGNETFTVSLEEDSANPLPQGVRLGAISATVTIIDDEALSVSVAAVTTIVTEGTDAVFRVFAVGGTSTADVAVTYTVSGTATAGSDYTAPSGSLTLAAGVAKRTVTIATLTDEMFDPDETLRVTLTEASMAKGEARVAAPPDNSATAAIEDAKEIVFRERLTRVSHAILPEMARATGDVTNGLIAERMARMTASTGEAASHARVGGSTLDRALYSNQRAIEDGTFAAKQLLAGSSFLLPLNEAAQATPTGVGALAAWGSGDWRRLSGDGDDGAVGWDGDVLGVHVGVDARLRTDLLAGLSVSWSEGRFDYDGTPSGGAYQHRMTSVHPYLGWAASEGLNVWATAGYGLGDIAISDDEIADEQSSDTTMKTAGAGANKTLLSDDDLVAGGVTTLKLKGDASFTRIEVVGRGLIDALSLDTSRLRLSLEGGHERRLAGGGSLTPSVELGVRHDGGDGVTGSGVELGGELRYRDPATGLIVSGRGRWLAAHSGGLGEWGIGGLVRLDPGAGKRGLSFSLGPAWGETESGVRRLWEEGAAGLTESDDAPAARLGAEIGYGLPALGGQSVLTPYGGLTLAGGGARHYRLGMRLDLGSAAAMGIEAERRENGAAAPDHGVMLRGQLQF